jgi:hypothetical protein
MTIWLDNARCAATDVPLSPGMEPPLGSHLVSPRRFYVHHGIYVGGGHVVHYPGLGNGLRRGPVIEVSLELFAGGHRVSVRDSVRIFDPGEIVTRARSRLGEDCYRILTNNCEHFCTWVLRDEGWSWQVQALRTILGPFSRALRGSYTSR